jgi:hypothetical protein
MTLPATGSATGPAGGGHSPSSGRPSAEVSDVPALPDQHARTIDILGSVPPTHDRPLSGDHPESASRQALPTIHPPSRRESWTHSSSGIRERMHDSLRAEVNQGDGAIVERTDHRFAVLAIVSSISRAAGGWRWLN